MPVFCAAVAASRLVKLDVRQSGALHDCSLLRAITGHATLNTLYIGLNWSWAFDYAQGQQHSREECASRLQALAEALAALLTSPASLTTLECSDCFLQNRATISVFKALAQPQARLIKLDIRNNGVRR